MASELLKTFQKIDRGRKYQIDRARALGHTVPDSASLSDLASYIAPTIDFPSYQGDGSDLIWNRPSEFPDCYTMLQGEPRDGLVPGLFILIKNDTTTRLPSYNNDNIVSGAAACLTSDGVWYNDLNVNTSHTWDTTKDIVINDGPYKGSYKWFLCYYDPNAVSLPNRFLLLTLLDPVEIVVNKIPVSNAYPEVSSWLFITNASASKYNKLINIEVLPESNITSLDALNFNAAYFFGTYASLEHVSIPTIHTIKWTYSSNNTYLAQFEAPKLRVLDLSNITTVNVHSSPMNKYQGFALNCPNLSIFKFGANSLVSSYCPMTKLKEFKIPNGTFRHIISNSNPNFGLPNNDNIVIKQISDNIPYNWTDTRGAVVVNGRYDTSSTTMNNYVCAKHPLLTHIIIDSNSYSGATADIAPNSPNLRYVTLNQGFVKTNLRINKIDLAYDCLIDILNKLGTGSGSTLTLGTANMSKLSEDEIKIATDKGWTVVE